MCFWIPVTNHPNAAALHSKGFQLWRSLETSPVYQVTPAGMTPPATAEGIRPPGPDYPLIENLFKLKGITRETLAAPAGDYFVQPVVERTDGRTDERFCTAFETEAEASADYNEHSGTNYAARMFWSVYHRHPEGTAEALSDHPDELQADALLRHLKRGPRITERQKLETFYDLVWNAGYDFGKGTKPAALGDDSRAMFEILLDWADEFNQRHAMTDWSDDEHDGEYLTLIDDFYTEKKKE